jgi:hypothetical protein
VPGGLNNSDLKKNSTGCGIFRDLLVWAERTRLGYLRLGELVKVRNNRLGVISSGLTSVLRSLVYPRFMGADSNLRFSESRDKTPIPRSSGLTLIPTLMG